MEMLVTREYPDNVTTEAYPTKPPALKLAYDIIIPLIVAVIMMAMGCGIRLAEVLAHLRKPIAPLIGLISQFIVMPAASFGIAHALQLLPHHAIGLIIVASCPGGTISNIFTYWSRGDLPLSICMTMLSSVLALGFMPLNMFIYLRSWTQHQASIPFVEIVIIIVITWVPVVIGMMIRHKAEKAAQIVIKVGSVAGFALIFVAGIIQGRLYPEFFDLPWNIWVGAFLHPVLGYLLGFILASISCLTLRMRRTVAFETGVQNSGLALTLITVSFKGRQYNLYSQYPLLYAAAQMVMGITISAAHIIYYCVKDKKQGTYSIKVDTEEDTDQEEGEVESETTLNDKDKNYSHISGFLEVNLIS